MNNNNEAEGGNDDSEWSDADKQALLESMKLHSPQDDSISFRSRMKKLNWAAIAVNGHSEQECRVMWETMLKKVRKYRTLAEVVADAAGKMLHPKNSSIRNKVSTKHPDDPPKPLTAYFRYLQDHRDKMKIKHPEMSPVELTKVLSKRWTSLSPTRQAKYQEIYKQERQQYLEARARFLEEHPEQVKRKIKRNKPPMQPRPFALFIQAKMARVKEKHPEINNVVAVNKLHKKYSALDPKKKMKWIKKAVDAVCEYQEDVKAYQKFHPEYLPPKKKVRLTADEQKLCHDMGIDIPGDKLFKDGLDDKHQKQLDSHETLPQSSNKEEQEDEVRVDSKQYRLPHFPEAPIEPPRSSFELFLQKKFGNLDTITPSIRTEAEGQWQSLGEKKRRHYEKKLLTCQQEYQDQLQQFKDTLSSEDLAAFRESLKEPSPRKVKKEN